ncbi:MAG: hypothetical protein AAFW84_15055, partial [Cyanobacteria bacterium J06635_15]
ALERDLGDPNNPDNLMSFQQTAAIDESEEFPHQEIAWLYNWQLQRFCQPVLFKMLCRTCHNRAMEKRGDREKTHSRLTMPWAC